VESFFSRYKNALVLILVLLVQVIGVAIQVRRPLPKEHAQPDAGGVRLVRYWAISLVSPPERFVHWIGNGISDIWLNYVDLIHVRRQNAELQAELRRLRIEQGGVAEDARQGQRLQQLLAFKEKYIYKTLPAQIIGTPGLDQSRILDIDKGAKEGVAVDMPVITPDGIVGRVREVFPHSAQVLEISDPTSGAGVILADTRIRGILRGNALGQPVVVGVMPDDRIKPGEKVITSGGDQIFPRGLAVGVVDHIVPDPERDPMVDIVIRPAANLSQLEEVLVITDMGSAITPKEKLDLIQSQAIADTEQLKASEILADRLPSRIDPDAPPEEQPIKTAGADGGTAPPVQPPQPLHPDHFSPNSTPPATSLVPGARAAAVLQDSGTKTPASAAKPHPVVPSSSNANTTETAAAATGAVPPKKKTTQLVPDDGSRPPAAMMVHPAETVRHAPVAAQPSARPANAVGAQTARGMQASEQNANRTTPPKTTVITDGPLPSGPRKITPAAPAIQKAPGTATKPPAQRKGPELVPDDGSRPPETMLHKPAKPQNQSTQQIAPQTAGGPQR
jgi:rod shape-determining protein MreC